MQGTLIDARVPELLDELGRKRESGVLQLSSDDVEKRVYFGQGAMVFARSSLHSDRLGEVLVKRGTISRTHLALASNKMRAEKEKLGRTLVSLGLLTETAVRDGLTDQARSIICSLFEWEQGRFAFERGAAPVEPDLSLELPRVPIFLEGTRLMSARAVREALGDAGRVLSLSKDPKVIDHYTTLTPAEGFVLSRVDGTFTLSDIVAMSPLSEVETLRCLYGLLTSGFIEIGRKSREVAPAKPRPSQPIDAFHRERPAVSHEPEPEPELEPAKEKSERERAGDEVRSRIDAKHEAVTSGTYYEWLEVERTVDTAGVKKAFSKLVKQFHPDRNQPGVVDTHGKKLGAILDRLKTAHDGLVDEVARRRYDNSLRSEAPRGEQVATPPKEPPPPPTPDAALAERYFEEARRTYARDDFHATIQLMEDAVRLAPDTGRYHRLLAQAQSKNPRWRKAAEQSFKTALACDRFDAEALVGLGELYEAVGLKRRAQSLFDEANEIDPLSVMRFRQGAVTAAEPRR